jgi:predicted nucleic-acid-binding Zn-ribbon protein
MSNPAPKPVVMKTFWKCPSCGVDNFADTDEVDKNGIEHPEHPGHTLAASMVCSKCGGRFSVSDIKVCGKTPGHAA